MQDNLSIKEIINLTGPNKKMLAPMLALIIISSLFDAISIGLFVPLIAGIIGSEDYVGEDSFLTEITNYIIQFSPSEELELAILCIFIILIFILKNIFVFLRVIFGTHLSNKLRAYWSTKIFKSLTQSSITNIVLNKQGKLINNIINEPIVSAKYVFTFVSLASKLLVTLVLILIMLSLSWQVTLAILLSSSIIFFSYLLVIDKRIRKLGNKRLLLVQKVTGLAQENLSAIRQVKVFLLENTVLKKFKETYEDLLDSLIKVAVYRNITLPLAEIGVIVCLIAALMYLNYFTNLDLNDFLPLFAFVVIASQKIAINLGGFASEKVALTSQKPSIIAINEMINDEMMKNEQDKEMKEVNSIDGDIVFKNVNFKYDQSKSEKVLDNINLRIKKNHIAAITGASGSGKSTIIDLICSFFRNYDGEILLGSNRLSDCRPSSIRSRIAYVNQDSLLFDATIKENILIANPELSDDEVKSFCRKANAEGFIEKLDNKYESQLIDRGQNISGGQRQRLTIARAFARDFDLLIIDEGLSALNVSTAKPILDHLIELRNQGKTIIMISHNDEHLSICDQILFIENGKISPLKN